jgi:hypothetical protein
MVKLIWAFLLIYVAMLALLMACRGMDAASSALRDWFRNRQPGRPDPYQGSTSNQRR